MLHRILGHRFSTRETSPNIRHCSCGRIEFAIITKRGTEWGARLNKGRSPKFRL